MKPSLIVLTPKGLYCPQADIYIDPIRSVEKALITHAHSDHARPGHSWYLSHPLTDVMMKVRFGKKINSETIEYGKTTTINGVTISFHPAGHVLGSAQIRLEYKGEIWVVSGDYKLEYDGISHEYESVTCHYFITEATFGLPIFQWRPQSDIFSQINSWWKDNAENNLTSILAGYSIGKAQRLLANVDHQIGNIYVHPAIESIHSAVETAGITFPKTDSFSSSLNHSKVKTGLVLVPPNLTNSDWLRQFEPYSYGFVSGWMISQQKKSTSNNEHHFTLSDHADWNGLLKAVHLSEAEHIYVTHSLDYSFCRYLQEMGLDANDLSVLGFQGEEL